MCISEMVNAALVGEIYYGVLNRLKKKKKPAETQPAGARPVGYHSGRYQKSTSGGVDALGALTQIGAFSVRARCSESLPAIFVRFHHKPQECYRGRETSVLEFSWCPMSQP